MKRIDGHTCAICNEPLKWWSEQSCLKCDRTLCNKHACTVRKLHSSVLYSFCPDCTPQPTAKHLAAEPKSLQQQHTHSQAALVITLLPE